MCLYITSLKPRRVKFVNGKKTMYKIFRITKDNKLLISPYRNITYRSGTTKARGKLDIRESVYVGSGKRIFGGAIHLYNSLRSAQLNGLSNHVIVPVTVYEKDFIAEGTDGEVCVSKIFISKKDYVKALEHK